MKSDGWRRDGHGGVKMSPVTGWNSAIFLCDISDIGLRIEFGDYPTSPNLSAFQFGLTVAQARRLSVELAAHADKLEGRR